MMDEAAVIKYLSDHWGLAGVLIASPGVVAIAYHKIRVNELKAQVDEQKADKADYRNVITGNTSAMTEMAGALRENTQTIRDIRNYMGKSI
jgi:hypothetical protein